MQSADGGSLVRRKGSGPADCQICSLLSRCDKWHFLVDCPLYRKLPVQHRVSLLEAAGICKKCLSHEKRDDRGAKHCAGRHGENHWMCLEFSDPEGGGTPKKLLPVVQHQPGRLVYRCRTLILDMFRIEPSTTVQGAYDVCNKDAMPHSQISTKYLQNRL
jgi:hypothetical protein